MSFFNPFLLLGLFLIAIPIAIHFLSSAKYKVEPFSGMMFLVESIKTRARTIKIQQILILLVRCLIFVALALAMGRPALESEYGIISGQPTTTIIIIDDSYSMLQGDDGSNAFSQAQSSAVRLIEKMKKSDNLAIISGGNKPNTLTTNLSYDKLFLKNKINNLKPRYDKINFARAIEQAYWIFENSKLPQHRLFIFTDGQLTGWSPDNRKAWKRVSDHRKVLKIQPKTYLLAQGSDNNIINIAPIAITHQAPLVDTIRTSQFNVELANYSSSVYDIYLKIYVDEKCVNEKKLTLKPGMNSTSFDYLFKSHGSHFIRVETSVDDLPIDNTLSYAINVMKKIPILIIESTTSSNMWISDSAMIKMALEAAGENNYEPLFEVTVRNQLEIDLLDYSYLEDFKTVILADVISLSDYFSYELKKFVNEGGGLFVSLGNDTEKENFNRLAKKRDSLFPAQLVKPYQYANSPGRPSFPAGNDSAMLSIYDINEDVVLNDVMIKKYWRTKPKEDSFTLCKVDDHPLGIFRAYGKGGVILWTSSINASWNNFPVTRDFLPLMQNLILCLSSKVTPPINLNVGDTLLYKWSKPLTGEELGLKHNIENCKLITPDNKEHIVEFKKVAGEMIFQWNDTILPGLYQVKVGQYPDRHFTVSPDRTESNLRLLDNDAKTLISAASKIEFIENEVNLNAIISEESGTYELWQLFIYIVLGLMALELFLSWRFS